VQLDALLAERGEAVETVLNMHATDDVRAARVHRVRKLPRSPTKHAAQVVLQRLQHRWVHTPSGRTYHTYFKPPKCPGKDDVTGDALVQRKDDTPCIIDSRLHTFRVLTVPILTHYKDIVRDIDANDDLDDVTAQVSAALRAPR